MPCPDDTSRAPRESSGKQERMTIEEKVSGHLRPFCQPPSFLGEEMELTGTLRGQGPQLLQLL